MYKPFTFGLVILLASGAMLTRPCYGQQEGGAKENIRQQETGFQKWMTEKPQGLYNNTSFAIISDRGNWFSGMQTTFGYKFNPHLGVGGGAGIERFTNLPTYDYYTANFTFLPVYAELRYTFLKSKVSPVIALDAGYKFLINTPSSQMDTWTTWLYPPYAWNDYYSWDTYTRGGPFFTIEAGVNFKIYRRLGLYASADYSLWSVSGVNNYWIYQYIYMSAPGETVKEFQYTEPVKAYQYCFMFRLGFTF